MITENELSRARSISPMLRPVNRLAKHKSPPPRLPKYLPHNVKLLQESKIPFSLNSLTPPQSTPDAGQLYLNAAAAALTQVEILDSSAAETLKKVIDYFSAEARFGGLDVVKMMKTREDGWKLADALREKIEELEAAQTVLKDQNQDYMLRLAKLDSQINQLTTQLKTAEIDKSTMKTTILHLETSNSQQNMQIQRLITEKLQKCQENVNLAENAVILRDKYENAIKARIQAEKDKKLAFDSVSAIEKELQLQIVKNEHIMKENTILSQWMERNQQNVQVERGEADYELDFLKSQNKKLEEENKSQQQQIYQQFISSGGKGIGEGFRIDLGKTGGYSVQQYGGGGFNRVQNVETGEFGCQCILSVKKQHTCLIDEFQDKRQLHDIVDIINQELSDESEDFQDEFIELSGSISENDDKNVLKMKIKQEFVTKKAAKQIYDELIKFKNLYKKYKARYVLLQAGQKVEISQAKQQILQEFQAQLYKELNKLKTVKQPQKIQFKGIIDIVSNDFNVKIINDVKYFTEQQDTFKHQLQNFDQNEQLISLPNGMKQIALSSKDFQCQINHYQEVHVNICKKCLQFIDKKQAGMDCDFDENVITDGMEAKDLLNAIKIKRQQNVEVETDEMAKKRTKRLLDYKNLRNRIMQNYKEQVQCVADIADRKEKIYKSQNVKNLNDKNLYQQLVDQLSTLKQEEQILAKQFENVRDTYLIQRAPVVQKLSETNQQLTNKEENSINSKLKGNRTSFKKLLEQGLQNFSQSSDNQQIFKKYPQTARYSTQNSNQQDLMTSINPPFKNQLPKLKEDNIKTEEFEPLKTQRSNHQKQLETIQDSHEQESRNQVQVLKLLQKQQFITDKDIQQMNQAINIKHNATLEKPAVFVPQKHQPSPQHKITPIYTTSDNPFKKITYLRELIKDGQKLALVKETLLTKQKLNQLKARQVKIERSILLQNKIFPAALKFNDKNNQQLIQNPQNANSLVNFNPKVKQLLHEISQTPISQTSSVLYVNLQPIKIFIETSQKQLPYLPIVKLNNINYLRLPQQFSIPTHLWVVQTIRTIRKHIKTQGNFSQNFLLWLHENYQFNVISNKLIFQLIIGIYFYQSFEGLIFLSQINNGVETQIVNQIFESIQNLTKIDFYSTETEFLRFDVKKMSKFAEKVGISVITQTGDIFELIFKILTEITSVQQNFRQNLTNLFKICSKNGSMQMGQFKQFYRDLDLVSNSEPEIFNQTSISASEFENLMQNSAFRSTDQLSQIAFQRLQIVNQIISDKGVERFLGVNQLRKEVMMSIDLDDGAKALILVGRLLQQVQGILEEK